MTMLTIALGFGVVVGVVRAVAWVHDVLSRSPLDLDPMSPRWLATIRNERQV